MYFLILRCLEMSYFSKYLYLLNFLKYCDSFLLKIKKRLILNSIIKKLFSENIFLKDVLITTRSYLSYVDIFALFENNTSFVLCDILKADHKECLCIVIITRC